MELRWRGSEVSQEEPTGRTAESQANPCLDLRRAAYKATWRPYRYRSQRYG